MPRRTIGIAICFLLLWGAACRRSPLPPRIVSLQVSDASEGDVSLRLDAAALKAHALAQLQRLAIMPIDLTAPPREGIDCKLRLELRLEAIEVEERGLLRAYASARLTRFGPIGGPPPVTHQVMAEQTYRQDQAKDEARAVLARRHLERALDDTLTGLMAQVKLHQASTDELLRTLADAQNVDMQIEATRVAAERRETKAVPALIALLKSERSEVRDTAVGALVEIGDGRAVAPLTRLSRFDDLLELPKVIDAVASLGGDEARTFLGFVASSHPAPEMRTLAQDGLRRLERRAASSAQRGRVP